MNSTLEHHLVELCYRFALDFACVAVVVHAVFLRLYKRKDLAFSFWILNLVTFAVAFMLVGVESNLGLSLGLFAVFGILRYRTEAMKIRELSYLFVTIGFGILNGIGSIPVAAALDAVLVVCVSVLQLGAREDSLVIKYDKVALLKPGNEAALLADLTQRLGVAAVRVHIEQLDLMRESADITVNYRCV